MSYFDWQTLSKPFTFQPVLPADDSCIKQDNVFEPIDYVKTGNIQLKIPAGSFPLFYTEGNPSGFPPPIIIAQYNYSISTPITIIDPNTTFFNTLNLLKSCVLAIRYRVGNVAHRYLFAKTVSVFAAFALNTRSLLPFPSYLNQIILGNFVIEIWQWQSVPGESVAVISQDIMLTTGIIYFPSSYEDAGNILNPISTCSLAQLETALPETVPTNQDPAGPWLTN